MTNEPCFLEIGELDMIMVRGYWRKCKSGLKVWVPRHLRRAGKRDGRVYLDELDLP